MCDRQYSGRLVGIIFFILLSVLMLSNARCAFAEETYTITFKNYNGETLDTLVCAAGQMPEYTGAEPARGTSSGYSYAFAGWQPEIVAADADATYTAVFDAITVCEPEINSYAGMSGEYAILAQKLRSVPQLAENVQVFITLPGDTDTYNILASELQIAGSDMAKLSSARQVTLHTVQGDIALDKSLLGCLKDMGNNITIKVGTVNVVNYQMYSALTDAQKAVADTARHFMNISFLQGETQLVLTEPASAGSGSFTVTVPYELQQPSARPVVSLIAADGTASRIASAYSGGRLSFTSAQSGYYAVTEEIITEDAFTVTLVPQTAAISAGREFVCSVVLTQTAKTQAGGSVQTFTVPIAYDNNLIWRGFAAAEGLSVSAQNDGSVFTLIDTDASDSFTLDSGESIVLGEVTFLAPDMAGLFRDGVYTVRDISIAAGNNEIAVSGCRYGVPAQAAASAAAVVHRVTVTFPAAFNGYSVADIQPGANLLVPYGEAFTFALTPADGYAAAEVSAGGEVIAPTGFADGVFTYTIPNVRESLTLDILPVAAVYGITYMDGADILHGLQPDSYTFGIGAVLPANAAKNGYLLAGWYADAECTGLPVSEIGAAEFGSKTFYAKWTPMPLKLTASAAWIDLTRGETMQPVDLAEFIADKGGTDGEIGIAMAAGSSLPQGLMLENGIISGAPQTADDGTARIIFTSPTGASAELMLTFTVRDILPLTVDLAAAGQEDYVSWELLDGFIEQNGCYYVPEGVDLRFSAAAAVGYILSVSAQSGGVTFTPQPDDQGIYTVAADKISESLTLTLHPEIDPDRITAFVPVREDVTGSGVICQPFSVYSGSRTLVLFNAPQAANGSLALADGTAIYRTAHYSGYTHAALIDLAGCASGDYAAYAADMLCIGTAPNEDLNYNMDVNGSGAFTITDISVLYDFTSLKKLQWQPDDKLLLIGDLNADMILDAKDVTAFVDVYMNGIGE